VITKTTFENKVLTVNTVSPSFSCSHCQHAHIEVVVPKQTESLDIYAHTIFGSIKVHGNSLKFKNLKLSATAGLIRLKDGVIENLDIKTNVGVVVLSRLQTTNAQIFTQFGSVCAHVFTSVVSTIEVTYGSVFAEHIGSLTSLSIITQLGKVYVTELFSTAEFTASVDYGFFDRKTFILFPRFLQSCHRTWDCYCQL
jgi:DUF4097 and DUF4098 domain-containing protein YvlB